MAAPFVATSRLSNIIQMIVLSRQTGILRAIRGHGPTREFGQVQFVDGEPQNALLGQMIGQMALNALNNWGECHYAFDEITVDDGWYSGVPSGPNGAGSFQRYSGQRERRYANCRRRQSRRRRNDIHPNC